MRVVVVGAVLLVLLLVVVNHVFLVERGEGDRQTRHDDRW